MPNWCFNSVTLKNSDPTMIIRAQKAFEAGEFFNEFVPVPKDLRDTAEGCFGDTEQQRELEIKQAYNIKNYGHKTWYDFCVNNWGTKWDVGSPDEVTKKDDHTLVLHFDSAWAPPIQFFESLEDYDFEVSAYYFEPGMGFCGQFTTEDGDDYYEIEESNVEWVRENIPEHIDQAMGISDLMSEFEDTEEA